jgi:tetratricopeptide (TPR) repeat protein
MSRAAPKSATVSGLGVDVPELRNARALWQMNRFDDALLLFEAAARKYPQNLLALVDGSRALGARFEIARAEEMLDRLLKAGGKRPEILHLAGQSYRMIFRPEKAMACFEKVAAKTKDIPDAFLELAILYERRHRLTEAETLIEECLENAPDYLEATLFKGRLLRRLRRESEAEALFHDLAQAEPNHPALRGQAWAEIAQMLDRREQYREAMAAMLHCKELLLQREGPILAESNAVIGQLNRLAHSLTGEDFRRWAETAPQALAMRTAVLTSFPRSGTTLLEQALDTHSGVVSSDEREAFARDIFPSLWLGPTSPAPTAAALNVTTASKLANLRQRYFDYMSAALNEPIGERIHLDKNPPLTLVLPGFLRLFPQTRLLIALRDPRDVVISCFMQYLPLNPNSVCFLTLERTAKRYANDMGIWRELREKIASPWLEVRYEDTVADIGREARRALEFLGLPWEDQVLNYRDRLKDKAVGSPTYEAVSQPIYTRAIGRWKHYEEYLAPVMAALQPSIDAFGYLT